MARENRLRAVGLCSVALALCLLTPVAASQGRVQLTVQGYGSVHGMLNDATVQPNGTVSMLMVVNDSLVTPQGSFPTSATGVWLGYLNGSTVSGTVNDAVGTVQICVFICQDANFVGMGVWSGQLNGSDAAGDFSGTITFTSSPVPQVLVGRPIPVVGTWTSSFQMPVQELPPQAWAFTLAFVVAASVVLTAGRRRV